MRSWACPLRAQHASPPFPAPFGSINKLGWGPREARPLLWLLPALGTLELMGLWAGWGARGTGRTKGHGAGAFLHIKRSAGMGSAVGRENRLGCR